MPGRSATCPLRTSSPALRRLAPRLTPAGITTVSPLQLDVLLHQRGIGARGHRRPGEHPERRAREEAAGEGMAGGRPPGHQGQPRRAVGGEVGMGESEAVDRDVVEGWNVARADHLLSENAAVRGGQGDTLAPGHRPYARAQQVERLRRRQPLGMMREAVVDQSPCHAPGRPAVRREAQG